MPILSWLRLLLTSETAQFQSDMKKAKAEAKEFARQAKETEQRNKDFGKSFKDLTGISLGAVTALAAVGTATRQTVKWMKDSLQATIDYGMEVKKLSTALGIGAQEASALIEIADDMMISTGQLEMGFKSALKQGIVPNIEGLIKMAKEYQALPTSLEKAQYAQEKFGRASMDMQRILEMQPEQILEMAKSARDTGKILSDAAVEQIDAARLALEDLGDAWEGFRIQFALGLVEGADKGSKGLLGFIQNITKTQMASNMLNEAIRQGIITYSDFEKASRSGEVVFGDAANNIEWITEKTLKFNKTMEEEEARLRNMVKPTEDAYAALDEFSDSYEDVADAVHAYAQQQQAALAIQEELQKSQADLVDAHHNLAAAQQDWMRSTGNDIINQLEAAGVKGEEYKNALTAIDDVYGTDYAIQNAYMEDTVALVAEYKKTGDIEAFKTKLAELKEVYMPLNEQVREAVDNVWRLKRQIDALQDKEIWIYTHMVTTNEEQAKLKTQTYVPKEQFGVENYVVPPGYPGDSYMMGVTSGEVISVTPAGEMPQAATTINLNLSVSGGDPKAVRRAAYEGVLAAQRARGMR